MGESNYLVKTEPSRTRHYNGKPLVLKEGDLVDITRREEEGLIGIGDLDFMKDRMYNCG